MLFSLRSGLCTDIFPYRSQRLDLALRAKDLDKALSGIALTRQSYNDWCSSVGL